MLRFSQWPLHSFLNPQRPTLRSRTLPSVAGTPAGKPAAAPCLYVNAQNGVRGNLHLMNQISVADILELPVQERIQLVEVIWESIAAFPNAIEVSPELKTELEARLADFERNPEAGYSWDQVKAHLKSGSWRTV